MKTRNYKSHNRGKTKKRKVIRKYNYSLKKQARQRKKRTYKTRGIIRKMGRHWLRGGFKNGYICESEGCVFHPSIITGSDDGVTKIYHNERIYNKEKESYALLDSVDPNYRYHCRIFSSGVLSPEEVRAKFTTQVRELKYDKPYFYIDMEYAGTPVGSMNNVDINPRFKEGLIRFITSVLNLRDSEGRFLVHGDPHAGNICYKIDKEGNYVFKYIDITNLVSVSGDDLIKPSSDITRQFASLMGTIRLVFGFSNKITDALLPIVMSAAARKYTDVLDEILHVLSNFNDFAGDSLATGATPASESSSYDYVSPVTSPESSPLPFNYRKNNALALGKRISMPALFDSPKMETLTLFDSNDRPSKRIKPSSLFDSNNKDVNSISSHKNFDLTDDDNDHNVRFSDVSSSSRD